MSGNGKRYNTEFRADAVRLVVEEGRFVNSVSNDLGINEQTLKNWFRLLVFSSTKFWSKC
ncbi:transposase [Clostridium sp. WLY-B-L2]|jgi:transposase|uniref:Transposase n=1 Tax=Clostridium aromativorans TaxID=2836848 RepID=A0ABS8NAY7_9CLOT|nr:transposase [Clostridium aromativorans]MCC9296821.1 transposase [Clostridium aromativorans]CAB1262643.1 hypothetical protein CLOSBL3_20550 [Clostridiaceae bacterium BL-3]